MLKRQLVQQLMDVPTDEYILLAIVFWLLWNNWWTLSLIKLSMGLISLQRKEKIRMFYCSNFISNQVGIKLLNNQNLCKYLPSPLTCTGNQASSTVRSCVICTDIFSQSQFHKRNEFCKLASSTANLLCSLEAFLKWQLYTVQALRTGRISFPLRGSAAFLRLHKIELGLQMRGVKPSGHFKC